MYIYIYIYIYVFIYDFQHRETIRSSGNSIFNGKITVS